MFATRSREQSVSMLVDKKQFISVLVKVVTIYLCWQSHAVIPIMLMRLG
jgi:hypothetical protein